MFHSPPPLAATPYPSIASIGPGISGLIARHIELAFRAMLRGPEVDHQRHFSRLVTGQPHPFGNFAVMAHSADEEAIRAAGEPLLACGAPSAIFFTADVPARAVDSLKSLGFVPHAGLPAMAIDIATLGATALPAGYTFARMTRAQRDAWAAAFATGYELPGPVGAQFAAALDDDPAHSSFQYFAVLKNSRLVCTSLVYLKDGVAGIYGVATVPEERGKGLGGHATAEALRIARRMGYHVGVLQSSEAGHPVYTRLGFTDFGELPLFIRIPS